jgi:hypothetical protein
MAIVKVKRRGRRAGVYLITLIGCLSLILGGQNEVYAQCGVDWTCQIVDDGGGINNVGQYTSLAYDGSGYPAISYYDYDDGDLKLAYDRNGDEAFTPTEIITVDSAGDVGMYSSLAFGTGPAISYYDYDNDSLKLAYDRNDDGDFSDSGEVIPADDGGGSAAVGQYTSLAFGTGPAISYLDVTNRTLKLAYDRNDDGDFSDDGEIITVDDTSALGLYTSLAFDTSGNAAISYFDWANVALKFAYDRNDNGVFTDAGEIITVDNTGYTGLYTSLAFGSGPAISYQDGFNEALKFAYDRNNNGNFGDAGEIVTVDSGGADSVGLYTSLAFGTGPAISYYNDTAGDLKFAYDGDDDGVFAAGEITTLDSAGFVGLYTSLAFGSGYPSISHYDATGDNLKLARYVPPPTEPTRYLPDPPIVMGNQTFSVTITFTNREDNINTIVLVDNAPSGWGIQVDPTWCNPSADNATVVGDQAQLEWDGPYPAATDFTAVYKVTVPGNVTAGFYTFTGGLLEYCSGVDCDYSVEVTGDSQVEVIDGTPVVGVTREVICNLLPGVTIMLDSIGPEVSDGDGLYQIMATETGDYDVVASKDGFRDRTRTITVEGQGPAFTVTCNFSGQYGLIPNAPDIWYALDCVNLWLYPPSPECALDIWTALDVVNAWQYPIVE